MNFLNVMIMKYRVLALVGMLALSAGAILHAQDYDDIYYDASKSTTVPVKSKVTKTAKTVAVYGEVPERYKVAAQGNYRVERDEDEYNRRGNFEPSYEVDINGDTIYFDDDAFANTRRIERFYNPDVVILSDDDDLVEIYYDESPSINLIVGSDWNYGTYGWASSYYPWYTGSYYPWYVHRFNPWYNDWYYSRWYDPWYSPYYYGSYWHSPYWHWGWTYSSWYRTGWGWNRHYAWNNWGWHHGTWDKPRRSVDRNMGRGLRDHNRVGLATNRDRGGRVVGMNRPSSMPSRDGNRSGGVGTSGSRRGGLATTRSGNLGSRSSSGVTTRSSGAVTRSTGGSRSGGSHSGSTYSGGSRSSSYGGGSRSSGGSYSGGSRGSSGGGGGHHGGSSGGGGRRR